MTIGHEKLDVYRLSIGYATWVYEKAWGCVPHGINQTYSVDFDPEERTSRQADPLDARTSRQ